MSCFGEKNLSAIYIYTCTSCIHFLLYASFHSFDLAYIPINDYMNSLLAKSFQHLHNFLVNDIFLMTKLKFYQWQVIIYTTCNKKTYYTLLLSIYMYLMYSIFIIHIIPFVSVLTYIPLSEYMNTPLTTNFQHLRNSLANCSS